MKFQDVVVCTVLGLAGLVGLAGLAGCGAEEADSPITVRS